MICFRKLLHCQKLTPLTAAVVNSCTCSRFSHCFESKFRVTSLHQVISSIWLHAGMSRPPGGRPSQEERKLTAEALENWRVLAGAFPPGTFTGMRTAPAAADQQQQPLPVAQQSTSVQSPTLSNSSQHSQQQLSASHGARPSWGA